MLTAALSSVTLILCVATVASATNFSPWWIRGFDFPRVQFSLAIVANTLVVLVTLGASSVVGAALLIISLACLGYQLWWIYPYTIIHAKEVDSCSDTGQHPTLTLLTSNVLQTNRNVDGLLSLIKEHQPDIIVTLESNQWWEKSLSCLDEVYQYSVKCPLENLYGMHVFSKLKLSNSTTEFLIQEDVPSIHTCVQLKDGQQVQLHFLHPAPPSPVENEHSSERDAELIIVAKKLAEVKMPVIVAGDLNDVAWSKTTRIFRHISGLKDPRIGRGMLNTFHAKYWFMRWPLDHLFHSQHFTLNTIRRLKLQGSDHFSLFSRLCLTSNADLRTRTITLDHDEKEFVEERIHGQNAGETEVPTPNS